MGNVVNNGIIGEERLKSFREALQAKKAAEKSNHRIMIVIMPDETNRNASNAHLPVTNLARLACAPVQHGDIHFEWEINEVFIGTRDSDNTILASLTHSIWPSTTKNTAPLAIATAYRLHKFQLARNRFGIIAESIKPNEPKFSTWPWAVRPT